MLPGAGSRNTLSCSRHHVGRLGAVSPVCRPVPLCLAAVTFSYLGGLGRQTLHATTATSVTCLLLTAGLFLTLDYTPGGVLDLLWHKPTTPVTLYLDSANASSLVANQSLYNAGSAFVEAGKEVMFKALILSGYVPGTAVPATADASQHIAGAAAAVGAVTNASAPRLADGRQWRFILDNGPVGLATSYLKSLDRMVVR
jgi:hypothetical protein